MAAVREWDAVAERVPAGDAAATRRTANRCCRVKPVELHSPLGHRIEVRRADDFVAIETHVAPAEVVTHDEHNIWLLRSQGAAQTKCGRDKAK